MVILRTALLAYLATACYSPDVRDCTVACDRAADCAPDQVCGADGFCAAEDVAGRCVQAAGADAGVDATKPDPPKPDAPPPATTVTLRVRIVGRGSVAIPTVGTCDAGSGQADCPFEVSKGLPLTLQAAPKNHWRFDGWSEACAGALTSTCTLVPSTNLSARAMFASESSDDAL